MEEVREEALSLKVFNTSAKQHSQQEEVPATQNCSHTEDSPGHRSLATDPWRLQWVQQVFCRGLRLGFCELLQGQLQGSAGRCIPVTNMDCEHPKPATLHHAKGSAISFISFILALLLSGEVSGRNLYSLPQVTALMWRPLQQTVEENGLWTTPLQQTTI